VSYKASSYTSWTPSSSGTGAFKGTRYQLNL
jgi:hypothetical protein